MKHILPLLTGLIVLTACATPPPTGAGQTQPAPAPTSANMPNPASVSCMQQGFTSKIRTAADGSQTGVCIFPDGSECDEWAYLRGECGPSIRSVSPSALTAIPTALPIDPADYQGWWTYTHPVYNFAIMLPDGWVVNEVTSKDSMMNGHMLRLGGQVTTGGTEYIRMTFRRVGETTMLWPTGVGPGEFVQQGIFDIGGLPARRVLLVCPSGEVTSIWYHDAEEDEANIVRREMEFGFIFSTEFHCEPGQSLSGKIQRMGEMVIASLKVP